MCTYLYKRSVSFLPLRVLAFLGRAPLPLIRQAPSESKVHELSARLVWPTAVRNSPYCCWLPPPPPLLLLLVRVGLSIILAVIETLQRVIWLFFFLSSPFSFPQNTTQAVRQIYLRSVLNMYEPRSRWAIAAPSDRFIGFSPLTVGRRDEFPFTCKSSAGQS